MKLTVDRDPLLKAVGRAVGVVMRNTTIPILSNLRLDASASGGLHLTATDLDIEIGVVAEAKVEQPGGLTVPATRLNDLLRNMPVGAEIGLELVKGGQRLKVACGRTKVELPTLPLADFPGFSADGLAAGGEIAPAVLARLFKQTRFAASSEATRYYICGVYLHALKPHGEGETVLRAVATDGHRLACAEVIAPEGFGEWPGMIVPAKTVDECLRLLDGETAAVLRGGPSKIALDIGGDRLISKLIDGAFPDYQRVIPAEASNPHTLKLDAVLLGHAVKRVMVMADDKSRGVRMVVEGDAVLLSCRSADTGMIEEAVEADYDGPPLTLGFNGKYLVDQLAHIGGEMVELRLAADPLSPVLFLDPADRRVRFVIMQMRV